MYQIVIATPLGELGTKLFTEEEKSEIEFKILGNISRLSYLKLELEDGQDLYMTKDMIGRRFSL